MHSQIMLPATVVLLAVPGLVGACGSVHTSSFYRCSVPHPACPCTKLLVKAVLAAWLHNCKHMDCRLRQVVRYYALVPHCRLAANCVGRIPLWRANPRFASKST